MNDSTYSIRQSAKRFFSGTLLSRIAGMLRDMSMAYAFGTQSSLSSFMVAFRLAHLFRRLFGEGALQSAFIPEFEALRHREESQAFAFFRDLIATLTLFLSLLILIGCLAIGAFLFWGDLQQSSSQEILFLTLLMLPSLLFICLFGLNASLLQCEKFFFISSAAPVAFNGVWIVTVLLLKYLEVQESMSWLACGVILACFFQWLITVPRTFWLVKQRLSSSIWKGIRLFSPAILSLSQPLFLGIVGVAAAQINNAMDSLFAYYAEAQGPAMLWYAIRLQQLPLALFGIAIAGAILPPLSRALKEKDWDRYQHFLDDALTNTFTLMLPMAVALLIMGDSCVNLVYGRGDFTTHSILGTTRCLWAYSIGLVPTSLVLILAPACYAQNNYRLPAYTSFLSMLLNLFLNALFIAWFEWGAMSVALATSFSAWVNLFFLGQALSTNTRPILSSATRKHIMKVGFATLFACLGTALFRTLFQPFPPLSSLAWNTSFLFPKQLSNQMLQLLYQVICFGGLFLLSCWILRLSFFQKPTSTLTAIKGKIV